MLPELRRLFAVGVTAGLVLTPPVASAAPPVAQSSCVATPLALPTGAPAGAASRVTKADDTGRYVVGEVNFGDFDYRPVLWESGVPRLLDSAPGESAGVVDVNSSGTVLGVSLDKEGSWQPWILSGGVYTLLERPDYMSTVNVSAINNRGDVVGSGMSAISDDLGSLVWPAGGKPRVLYMEDGRYSTANDINDAGVVIGTAPYGGWTTGVRWETWDAFGSFVFGQNGSRSGLKEIRGRWTGGSEVLDKPAGEFIGMLWKDADTERHPLPGEPASVNSTGDAVTFDQNGNDVVLTSSGTVRWVFPQPTTIRTLTNRGERRPEAIGDITTNGITHAATWSGCSPVLPTSTTK